MCQYIHSHQMPDGGYFFASVTPGNLVESFLRGELIQSMHYLYLITGVLEVLGQRTDLSEGVGRSVMRLLRHRISGSGQDKIDIEVVSELQGIYEAVRTLQRLDLPVPVPTLARFVSSLRNEDGSFGGAGWSTLAATYYAVRTFMVLGLPVDEPRRAVAFLRHREGDMHFLEDLYYLVGALRCLGEAPLDPSGVVSFVLACQRYNGGFARAVSIGIPTLQYTYYAVSILERMNFLSGGKSHPETGGIKRYGRFRNF